MSHGPLGRHTGSLPGKHARLSPPTSKPSLETRLTVVGHNVGFDVAFLRQLAFQAGLNEVPLISHRVIDTHTMLYLLHLSGVIPEDALSSDGAFRHFEIGPQAFARHTALGDALATRELFMRVLELWDRASATL